MLTFEQIKNLFGNEFIKKNNIVEFYLSDIMSKGLQDDLNYVLSEYDPYKLFKQVMFYMQIYNYSKKSNAYYLFSKLLSNQTLANEYLNEIVEMFFEASLFYKITLKDWNLDKLENNDISIMNGLIVGLENAKKKPQTGYSYYFRKELEKEWDKNKKRVDFLKGILDDYIDNIKTFFVNKSILAYINANYKYDKKKKIVEKIINVYQYLNVNIHKFFYEDNKNEVIIDPSDVCRSLGEYSKTKGDAYIINQLCSRNEIFVKYKIDGKLCEGWDASGLTKELYAQLSGQVLDKYTKKVDGYNIPDSQLTEDVWFLIGVFLGRSLLVDKIRFSLNLHPIICYLILNKGIIKSFDKVYDELCIYDFEYIKNLQKVNLLNDEDYLDFIESFNDCSDDEETKKPEKTLKEIQKDKNNYLCGQLFETYIASSKNSIKGLINGYMSLYNKMLYSMDTHGIIIRTNNLHMSIIAEQNYNLNDLANVLKVSSYNDNKLVKIDLFKQNFIEILKELQKKDIDKLRSVFKFWFGNYMVSSFYDLTPAPCLSINDYEFYGCFGSATCFNTLKVESKALRNNRDYKEFIRNTMTKSIKNQELSSAAGMYMQLM
jgi:hypothetical protein